MEKRVSYKLVNGSLDLELRGKRGLHIVLDTQDVTSRSGLLVSQDVTWQELFASNPEIKKKPQLILEYVRELRQLCIFRTHFIVFSRVKNQGVLCLNVRFEEISIRMWDFVVHRHHGLALLETPSCSLFVYQIVARGKAWYLTLECKNGLRVSLVTDETEILCKEPYLRPLNKTLTRQPALLSVFAQSVKYVAFSQRELVILCRSKAVCSDAHDFLCLYFNLQK